MPQMVSTVYISSNSSEIFSKLSKILVIHSVLVILRIKQ